MTARTATSIEPPTQRFAPRWLVFAASGTTVAALVALFPGQVLVTSVAGNVATDAVSLAYLQLLLRSRPEDASVRLSLAQSLGKLGRFEQARATLQPLLLRDGPAGPPTRLLALELSLRAAASERPSSPERARLLERARVDLTRLAPGGLDAQQSASLARLCEAAGLPAASLRPASLLAEAGNAQPPAPLVPPTKLQAGGTSSGAIGVSNPISEWRASAPSSASPSPDEAASWIHQADLAEQRHEFDGMVYALQLAIASPGGSAVACERLVAFHNAQRQSREAIAVAMQAHARFGEARWLLLAMDAASRGDQWDELKRVWLLARKQAPQVSDSQMFWLLQARLAQHDGDDRLTREAFDRILELNPTAIVTRVQAVWFELDKGDAFRLIALLEGGATQAEDERSAWTAYASGFLRAGRVQDSLHWFEKAFAYGQEDLAWATGYLDTLEQAGHQRQADSWRAALLPRMDVAWEESLATGGHNLADFGRVYAAVLASTRGERAQQQVLQELAYHGAADAATYERLISVSLKDNKFDAARAWMKQAERDHQRVSGYQQLALALHDSDTAKLDALLSDRDAALGTADQVTALRRLGRYTQAMQVAQAALHDTTDPSRELLLRHRQELQRLLARHVTADVELRSLTGLNIHRYEMSGSAPVGDTRLLTAQAARIELRPGSDTGFTAVRSLNETEGAVQLRLPVAGQELTARLGRNDRDQDSLTQVSLQLAHHGTSGLQLRLIGSGNEIPLETSLLRAVGAKDRVSLYMSAKLTSDIYAGAELSANRFKTRSGQHLASGERLVAEVGATLPHEPRWQVRLSGSTEHNRLEDTVPEAVAATITPVPASVEAIVPRRFSTFGAGATFRSDPLGTSGGPNILLDGWLGRQWPAAETAYSLRAALEVPVARADRLTIQASYSNVQRQAKGQASRSFAVQYRHEF